MADSAMTDRPARRRSSVFERLRSRLRRSRAAPAPQARTAPTALAPSLARAAGPPPDLLTVRQWLYGPGYTIPGNADYVLELVKPFHLGPSMTVLDMAAGLGGPAESVAEAFKTYVAGFERDPALARRASDAATAHGLARHVQVNVYDPESFELRAGFYDHALAREATYAVAQKERFLRVLNQAMKPSGQLVLTEFVRDRAAGERPELAACEASCGQKPQLWTAAQYTDCLKSLGFDLRIASDVTAEYRRMILLGWKGFLESGRLKLLPKTQAAPVIDAVERDLRAVAALSSGALKFYYFVALGGRRRATAS